VWKKEMEDHRALDQVDYKNAMEAWQKNQPPDSNTLVARILREFLDTAIDIDFAARQRVVVGEGGSGLGFVNEAYNKKPWQWRAAYEFGPEAIAAARAAAQQWLKELGGATAIP
jgi:hypothetical protein